VDESLSLDTCRILMTILGEKAKRRRTIEE
jgi:hypothetical protein